MSEFLDDEIPGFPGVTRGELAWGLLTAVLVANGGRVRMSMEQFETDCMGNMAGELYALGFGAAEDAPGMIDLYVLPTKPKGPETHG